MKNRKIWSGIDPNPRHTLYYKRQLPELAEDWLRFQETMSNELPVTFRVCLYRDPFTASALESMMKTRFETMAGRYIEVKGEVLEGKVVHQVQAFGRGTFELAVDSATLAKDEGLQSLNDLLKREVALGNIVRQELVSMIPAVLLNVKYDHWVLDMCAAPGSKTEQILSAMDEDAARCHIKVCTGLVVANDADQKRIQTLKNRHRCSRSPRLVITCSRAEDLRRKFQHPVFDRILCDVPCSGDGTFRKSPHLWRLFRPRTAVELHSIQLQIAVSSVLLLKPGGRMVYSTCSLNPIEDEAVVAGLLSLFRGKLKIIDSAHEELLPGFRFRCGKTYWECSNDVFSLGELNEDDRKETINRLPELLPSMFPPTADMAHDLHLDKCLRVLPQDQNTGGFFIAVLELTEALSVEERSKFDQAHRGTGSLYEEVDVNKSSDVMRNLGTNQYCDRPTTCN